MNGAEEDFEGGALSGDDGIYAVEASEAFIGANDVIGDVPVPCPYTAPGRQRQLEPFVRLGLVGGETNLLGDFGDENHDAGGVAVFVRNWGVVEIEPGGFGTGSPIQHQFLMLERPGLTGKAASNVGVVEVGDFRPALAGAHAGSSGCRLPAKRAYPSL